MAAGITITGLEQVQRRLREAPSLLVAKAMHTALDRGIGVIAAEVEALTPEDTGDLKEHVITRVEIDVQNRGGSAAVGFASTPHERTGRASDAVALWVEMGHRMVSHDGKEIGHVPPHPFMRTAFTVAADRAIEVFAETLIEGLSVIGEGE